MILCSLCFKTKDESDDKNFFKVPKEKRRRKQWGAICRIDFKKKVAWICKDHFLPSQLVKDGNKIVLSPKAIPFIPRVKEPEKVLEAAYKSELKSQMLQIKEEIFEMTTADDELEQQTGAEEKQDVQKKSAVKKVAKKRKKVQEKLPLELSSSNAIPPPPMLENFVMEIPVKKTVFCARSTQTNTRLCGLVQTSEYADDFRLNCFYCFDVFPFEKWKDFITHTKEKHFAKEKAFEVCEYISEEHDYTPTNLSSTRSFPPLLETIGISPESLLPFLGNEEEPTIPVKPSFVCTSDGNMAVPDNMQFLNDLMLDAENPFIIDGGQNDNNKTLVDKSKMTKPKKQAKISTPTKNKNSKQKILGINQMGNTIKQVPKKTVLSRCLKRTIKKEPKVEVRDVFDSAIKEMEKQITPIISYEYSPSALVHFLLDSMKNYPILWQFNTEPYNDDFCKSIEELCDIINARWLLNFDLLTMRRSINRVLRFYCYLFPNENIENIHPFTSYYDKCAEFLPASVNEIAYSRCYNCYICFKCDSDLKRHLLKEESSTILWPHKCVECKEYFAHNDEYEFHKRLPHYVEVFRCETCKKKYFRRNIYNKHMADYHCPNENNDERKYKCDKCEKDYRTSSGLAAHKIVHGEKKNKCHLCPKSYHEKSRLKIHLKTHRNELDYICEVCAKEFVTQSALNVHMNTHTGAKVTCTICNLRLRRSSLSRHLRLVHTAGVDGRNPQAAGRIRKYRRLIRTRPFRRRKECERRRYQCKICVIDFERYKEMAEHNKSMHSDNRKWSCELCDVLFSRKENLKRHYRKKHDLHVIQVYKLIEEGVDLDEVLSIKPEQLEALAESTTGFHAEIPPEVKSEYLSDVNSSEEENMESFTIQDEIMEATENITKEEVKIDYMSEFFREILK